MKILPKNIIKASLFIFTFCLTHFLSTPTAQAYVIGPTDPTDTAVTKSVEEALADETYWKREDDDFDAFSRRLPSSGLIVLLGPATEELQNLFAQKRLPAGGAVGATTQLIASMIGNPPVSTGEYLADLGSSLGLPIKPAYAQGVGYEALRPIMQIWKAFRNISYMAFVIIFVALGFMIMFRTKINPQTVISIQEVFPKIVITLLLITFSYAIASLLIDLIYVIIYLAIGLFAGSELLTSGGQPALNKIFNESLWQIVFTKGSGGLANYLFVGSPAAAVSEIVLLLGGENWLAKISSEALGGLTAFVLAIIIFFSMFKLFMSLLTSYVSIILSVVFAPFSLLLNVFPGSNSFTAWIRNLFANIAVFPIVAIMFVLAAILVGPGETLNPWGVTGASYSTTDEPGWTPPFLVGGPLSGGGGSLPQTGVILNLIAVGILLLIPHTVDLVKKTLKVEASPLTAILGAAPQAVAAAPGRGIQTGLGLLTQMHYARAELKDIKDSISGVTAKFRKGKGTPRAGEERAG